MNMNKIDRDELYGHVREFLQGKGVELQEGSYSRRIQQGCHMLAKTINGSHDALKRLKAEADRGLDKVRQVIHEQTAPKPPPGPRTSKDATASARAAAPAAAKTAPNKPKPRAARLTKKSR
jgi:hypothetical protein